MELTDKEYKELEDLKADLKWQLTFEDVDWVHFIDTAKRAKKIEDKKL